MTDKLTKDFYLMHYTYYFDNNTQRGEGNLYLEASTGAGLRKKDIDGAIDHILVGLENNLGTQVVVVTNGIYYLTSCSNEEFYAS